MTNERDERALVGVKIKGEEGSTLFSHVYELEAGTTDESAGDGHIETQPTSVLVFTPAEAPQRWEYTADTDLECSVQDVGIRLLSEGAIEFYNSC